MLRRQKQAFAEYEPLCVHRIRRCYKELAKAQTHQKEDNKIEEKSRPDAGFIIVSREVTTRAKNKQRNKSNDRQAGERRPNKFEILSATQRAQISETPKSVPESGLRSAVRNRGVLRSAPESALEGALLVVHHRESLPFTTENPSRALSAALLRAPRFLRTILRALSGAVLGVSLIWAVWLADRISTINGQMMAATQL